MYSRLEGRQGGDARRDLEAVHLGTVDPEAAGAGQLLVADRALEVLGLLPVHTTQWLGLLCHCPPCVGRCSGRLLNTSTSLRCWGCPTF